MEKFRWAFIGSGSIARKVASDISKGNHCVVSVYSRNFEKAKQLADRFSAKAYETAEQAISAEDVDGVYIATPHTSHVEYSLMALKMHKSVLCEKPVAVSEKEVQLLIDTAKENGTYFAEAMWTWFSDVALTVKDWVKNDRVGDVQSVKIHYAFPGIKMAEDSRVRDPLTAGGALLDIGIYPITYCYNLFGYPDKIRCEGTVDKGIDINEHITLTYGDLNCELYISLEHLKEKLSLKGTMGRIYLPVFHASPVAVLTGRKGNKVFLGKTDYITEFDRVVKEIREGKTESDYVPFKSTAECMRIMDECRRQMNLKYPFED